MIDIGIGLSSGKNAMLAAEEAVRLAKKNKKDSGKIDLAVVFSTLDLSAANICKTLNSFLGGIPILGSNGAAIISEQGIFKRGLILMLLSFPEGVYFSTAYVKDLSSKIPLHSGEEFGEKLLYGFKNIPRNLGLVFFDRPIDGGSNFISGMQEHLGRSFPFLGASASSTLQSVKTSLYFNQGILSNACTGILWGGRLTFGIGIKHGWKPLGKPHIASSAVGNLVKEIDGQPAVRLYEEYLACNLAKLKKELQYLSLSYPIGVFITQGEEYLLRNILGIEEDGSLLCQGNVPEGSTIRLMISTKETCLEATRQAAEEARKNLAGSLMKFGKEKTSRLAIAFSSFSRYNLLRRDAKRELEIIKANLDVNTPIIGLYTHGEMAPLKTSSYRGQIYFHNQTVNILILEA